MIFNRNITKTALGDRHMKRGKLHCSYIYIAPFISSHTDNEFKRALGPAAGVFQSAPLTIMILFIYLPCICPVPEKMGLHPHTPAPLKIYLDFFITLYRHANEQVACRQHC